MKKPAAVLLASVLFPLACTNDSGDPNGTEPDAPETEVVDASILPKDAPTTVIDSPPSQTIDAPRPKIDAPKIDARPHDLIYPNGPYGTAQYSIIKNEEWYGYVDSSADADNDPFNEAPRLFKLQEVYANNDGPAELIMINSSTAWCGYCQQEAAKLSALAAKWGPKGGRIITTISQDSYKNPADLDDVRHWGQTYGLTVPTLADPDWIMGNYFESGYGVLPMNVFIHAKTMMIISIKYGWTDGELERVFDYYLD
ncbi:MAG: redoxin domain-containing protein [Pseudomonadota bacterium]